MVDPWTFADPCPICGFPGVELNEICPACHFQFGYTDGLDGFSYEKYQKQWVERGMPWTAIGIEKPSWWNPSERELPNVSDDADDPLDFLKAENEEPKSDD